jgi:uridine nucleosidase
LFSKVFPQLLLDKVERIILMGGAEGRGNKSPVAESNILCDAHAASIVFDLNLPVVICVS